jgi:hypothetical protein
MTGRRSNNGSRPDWRHPLSDWVLSRYTPKMRCLDVPSLIMEMGCPQAGRDASRANKAFRVVAADVLECMVGRGELTRDRMGWYVLPDDKAGS